MFGNLKNIVRDIRVSLLRIKANALRPFSADNNILVIAPHPDDEIFGCAGMIKQAIEQGKKVNVLILSGGGKSHSGCCNINEEILISERRDLSRNAAKILGLSLDNLHFLNYPDGNISFESSETLRLAELIDELNPKAVFVPHFGEGWSDHIETGNIVRRLLQDRVCVKLYEYCVWFWYYNTWRIDWKQARLLRMDEMQYRTKLKAIDAYVRPLAPCGKPWSGVLPRVFIKANSWNKELYFEVKR